MQLMRPEVGMVTWSNVTSSCRFAGAGNNPAQHGVDTSSAAARTDARVMDISRSGFSRSMYLKTGTVSTILPQTRHCLGSRPHLILWHRSEGLFFRITSGAGAPHVPAARPSETMLTETGMTRTVTFLLFFVLALAAGTNAQVIDFWNAQDREAAPTKGVVPW